MSFYYIELTDDMCRVSVIYGTRGRQCLLNQCNKVQPMKITHTLISDTIQRFTVYFMYVVEMNVLKLIFIT